MNIIILYQSVTGFTKQYAVWIAEELGCRAVSQKEADKKEVESADLVLFGGWIMGGKIVGLEDLKKWKVKKQVVFGVGSMPEELVDTLSMKVQNHLEEIPFFYMPGGLRFEKLNLFIRGVLKVMKIFMIKKEEKTPQEQFMAGALATSFDYTDRRYIEDLVNYVRRNDVCPCPERVYLSAKKISS